MTMIDATVIAHFQSCQRRDVLERSWQSPRWRAKSLWEREFRQAIVALSQGADLNEVVRVHRAKFLGQCANPGLDLPQGTNPFIIAKDLVMMLEMVLRVMKRSTLLELHPHPPVNIPTPDMKLPSCFDWRVLAPVDGSGVLHRWITCDRWDADEFSRQVHGWWTFGDMAVTRRAMTLHVIEIGQMRTGRRDSCWTRGLRSKYAPNLPLRFKRPEKNPGDWVSEYLADKRADVEETEKWVDALLKDGLVAKHILHLPLQSLPDEVCEEGRRQILAIAVERRDLTYDRWSDVAMARSACDGLVPCPWQDCCYRWPVEDPEELGFVRLDRVSGTVRALGEEPSSTVQVVPQAHTLEPSRSPDTPDNH